MSNKGEVKKTFIISAESDELLLDITYALKKELGKKVTQGRILDTAIRHMIKGKTVKEILEILGDDI